METKINARHLLATLPDVVRRVRKGARFTVLYRSRPAFRIVPLDTAAAPTSDLAEDGLYQARPVGRSRDGLSSTDHDTTLYGK